MFNIKLKKGVINMNKLTKIGASALAGALVSLSAQAAEWNVSGSAGFTINGYDEGTAESGYSQDDSIKVSASGTTENGINVAAYYEIDDAAAAGPYDDKWVSFGTDGLGTVKFWGTGGSSVMGAFDDITPKAYEEVWDVGVQGGTTTLSAADSRINGTAGEMMFYYTSPSVAGAEFHASLQTKSTTVGTTGNDGKGSDNKYFDMGVKYAPEMVEGLTLYYAQGTRENGAVDHDESTIGITYAYGPITVGYQESEEDIANTAADNELEQYSIAYQVSDNLSISYGEREYDHDTSKNVLTGDLTQKDSGFGVSYTMGGVSIGGSMNSHDNNAGATAAAADFDSYELNVSFAF
jgi:outer membrane protein OmpU